MGLLVLSVKGHAKLLKAGLSIDEKFLKKSLASEEKIA